MTSALNTSTEKTELHGIVENIVYQNSDTGYGVIEIDADGMAVTLVGDLAFVKVGEEVEAYGNYVTHPNYGVQFRCDAIERTLPTSATAIMKYLSNGAVTGIGPSTAKKLVKAFGTQTLEVMAREPEKLVEIKGISMEKAKAISSELAQMFGLKETQKLHSVVAFGYPTHKSTIVDQGEDGSLNYYVDEAVDYYVKKRKLSDTVSFY